MSKRRIFFFISALVITAAVVSAAVWSIAVQTTSAQDRGGGAVQTTSAQDTDGDLEQFRSKLADYYGHWLEVYPYIADFASPDLVQRTIEAQRNVDELTPEELAPLKLMFSQNPALWDTPKELLAYFELAQARQGQRGLVEGSQDGMVGIGSGCPPGPGVLAEYIARDALQVWQFALAFVPQDMVVVVLGEGGTTWAHPAKIALQVAYEASAVAVLALEQANALADECELGVDRWLFRDQVVPRIDVAVSTRASQASLDAHDAKMEGKMDMAQYTLDNLVELRQVHLEVTQLGGLGRFLVSASDAGQPLADVEFISVQVALEASPSFIDVTALTMVSVAGEGIYLVQIALPANVTYATLFAFEVKHNNGVVDHFGFTLFQGKTMNQW